nr:immunoglobulin light chain junction region [Macaca mulatta]MOW02900.1 immunoglobulin light chain junction region [Macaca mulatta]
DYYCMICHNSAALF